MTSRPFRSVAAALAIAAVLFLAAPATAQAGTFDFAARISSRAVGMLEQGQVLFTSLWRGLSDFVASSTATMCGDGVT